MQSEPITLTIPADNELLTGLGADPKSLEAGTEINLTGKVTASDDNGVTVEVTAAEMPEEAGTPETPEEEAGEGEPDTSGATDYVKKQRSMGT